MERDILDSKKNSNGTLIVWLLVISCLYKITVVTDGLFQKLLSPILNILPLSGISRYTNSLSIVKIYIVGISLHMVCCIYWLSKERWKIRINRSICEESLLLIFAIRMISEFWVHKRIGIYSLVFDLLCIFFILVFYQIRLDRDDIENIQGQVSRCIYQISWVCAIVAVMYYLVGLGQTFSSFTFRTNRIGGFLFDAILAGFIYGIGLLSAFDLHKNGKIRKIELVAACIFFPVGMLLTGSRSALYFLAFAIFYFVGSKKSYSKFLYIGLFVVLAVIVYSSFVAEQEINFVSDGARSYKYGLAFDVFTKHPITGVGTNMFHFYDEIYGSNPHNLPLTLLAENGIIGFLPWIIWIVASVKNVVKTSNQYWRWLMISFFTLSMIVGTLSNAITVIILAMVTWACEVTANPEKYVRV